MAALNRRGRELTIAEAVATAIRQKGRPLSPQEAYAVIVEADLYRFNSDDPVHIVRNQIRRRCEGLDFPTALSAKVFRATNDGRYDLLDAAPVSAPTNLEREPAATLSQLMSLMRIHEQDVRARALEALKALTPTAFERFAQRLLRAYGFEEVKVTGRSRDGGIDGHGQIRIGLTTVSVAFQCKRWLDKPVGRDRIDAFRGATSGLHEQGYVFTTSRFTPEAIEAQRRPGAVPIVLFDGERIVDIMFDRQFGVGFRELRIPELDIDVVLEEG